MNSLSFIDDPPRDGALNMALDHFLSLQIRQSGMAGVLRLYRWERPTLSCGFHQRAERRIDFAGCQRFSVDVVRRPTGGRELLHDGDLSFSLVISRGLGYENTDGPRKFFYHAGKIIIGGLRSLGIEAALIEGSKPGGHSRFAPCLAAFSQFEIVSAGRKLVPIAQRVYQDVILAHGSIPLANTKIPTAELLQLKEKAKVQQLIDKASVSIGELLPGEVDLDLLKESLLTNFGKIFGGQVIPKELSGEELAHAANDRLNWVINKKGK